MDLLLGIDAGTSVIKVVAFDLQGNQIAVAAKANHYEILPNGGVEQELERTWADTLTVIHQILEKLDGHQIVGITDGRGVDIRGIRTRIQESTEVRNLGAFVIGNEHRSAPGGAGTQSGCSAVVSDGGLKISSW